VLIISPTSSLENDDGGEIQSRARNLEAKVRRGSPSSGPERVMRVRNGLAVASVRMRGCKRRMRRGRVHLPRGTCSSSSRLRIRYERFARRVTETVSARRGWDFTCFGSVRDGRAGPFVSTRVFRPETRNGKSLCFGNGLFEFTEFL
jgi:hypothetical protein